MKVICRLLSVSGLFFLSTTALAGGSLGVDYLSSEVVVSGFRDTETRIESAGPGASWAFDLSDNWAVNLGYSRIDSGGQVQTSTNNRISMKVESQTTAASLGLSYYGENFWFGLRLRQSEDEQQVRGFSRINSALDLDIDQVQDSQSISFEIGRDWLFGNWSPALSANLSHQKLDIQREERLNTLNLSTIEGLEENLSGLDLGISASISYYFQLSDSVLLAPSLGIFHQINLSGDVSGLAAYSWSRGGRNIRSSQDYREELNQLQDTSVDFGLSLLAGDWLVSIGGLSSLSSGVRDSSSPSWFVGLGYAY